MNRINPCEVLITMITIVISFSSSSAYSRSAERFLPPYVHHDLQTSKEFAMLTGIGNTDDVKYYRRWPRANPDTSVGTYIYGNPNLYFETPQPNLHQLQVSFISNLRVDSAKSHEVEIRSESIVEVIDAVNLTFPTILSIPSVHTVPNPANDYIYIDAINTISAKKASIRVHIRGRIMAKLAAVNKSKVYYKIGLIEDIVEVNNNRIYGMKKIIKP